MKMAIPTQRSWPLCWLRRRHLLRVFDAAGIAPMDAGFSRMHCCFAVGADLYGGIAAQRQRRAAAQGSVSIGRLAEACGVASGPILNDLQGVTSARQMTRLDADTNMLRGGTALLGMVLGGVGVATSLPHDWLTGSRMESRLAGAQQPSYHGRRSPA